MVDQRGLLTALTVFLLSAGPDVCSVQPLHVLCVQRFAVGMDAKDAAVSSRRTSSVVSRELCQPSSCFRS